MRRIIGYLRGYLSELNKAVFLCATVLTTLAVFLNYHYNLNKQITALPEAVQFVSWYGLFLVAFGGGYVLQAIFLKSRFFQHKKFVALLLLAPAVFAWKMSAHIQYDFTEDVFKDEYWNAVIYWPFKAIVMLAMLHLVRRVFDKGQPFYGVTFRGFHAKPYFFMLLAMVPLIAVASTQKDFLAAYPRFQAIEYLLQPDRGWQKILYELSYGTDFFSIELFFRGFLVLSFAKWAGEEAILPMAMFYCFIHFGKPLGECISSYFGGLVLGVVSYHTRTVFGGFLVHVGIAWLMEAGGQIGHQLF